TRGLFVHPHCVNELPVARAALTSPAGTDDPVFLFRQLNNILPTPPALCGFSLLIEFAATQRTHTEIGVRFAPFVMINDVGVNSHDGLLYRTPCTQLGRRSTLPDRRVCDIKMMDCGFPFFWA